MVSLSLSLSLSLGEGEAPHTTKLVVVHVVESFAAGCLVALATLCRNVPDVRHEIIHSIRPETQPDFRRLFPEEVIFHYLPMVRNVHPLADARAFFQLRRYLRGLEADVIHCHSSKAGFLGRFAAWSLGLPSLYTPHGYAFLRTDLNRFKRICFRLAEWLGARAGIAVAACGREEYDLARGLGGAAKRVILIPNGLNLEDMDHLASLGDAATQAAAGDTAVTVGTCGRVSPQRDPGLFAELMNSSGSEIHWTWIGAKRNSEELPRGVETSGWLSHEEALRRVAALDIYVQTSRWEGLSYALLEAMAMGKPVVVSDIPSNRAIVRHGVTGFLGMNGPEMAAYVHRLARDASLRRRMGDAAREYVRRHHDARRSGRIYLRLYERLARLRREGRMGTPMRN